MAGERTRTVAVRLTPDEHAAWLAAATTAGRGRLGSWTRDQIAASLAAPAGAAAPAGGAPGRARPPADLPMRAQVVRVGNLLNQAVRQGHRAGLDAAGAAALSAALMAVHQVLVEVNVELRARP